MKRRRKRRPVQPGQAPGTLAPESENGGPLPEILLIDYSSSTCTERPVTRLEEITPPPAGTYRWVQVRGVPGPRLLQALGRAFSVHALILEDIGGQGQRVKVEEYDNLLYTVLRTVKVGGKFELEEDELSMILTENTLITVHETDEATFYAPIRARLANPESFLRRSQIDFLYYAVIDLVVDCCFPVLQALEEGAADVESGILAEATREEVRSVHLLRGATRRLRSLLWATRDVVSRIERSASRFLRKETLFYFRDVHDHVVHLLDEVSALRDSANAMMELYMSGISNRMNEIVKVLTIISTLFIPVTFIAGVYGMNFLYMPELDVRWAYPAVLLLMSLVVGGMLLFFRRKKWI